MSKPGTQRPVVSTLARGFLLAVALVATAGAQAGAMSVGTATSILTLDSIAGATGGVPAGFVIELVESTDEVFEDVLEGDASTAGSFAFTDEFVAPGDTALPLSEGDVITLDANATAVANTGPGAEAFVSSLTNLSIFMENNSTEEVTVSFSLDFGMTVDASVDAPGDVTLEDALADAFVTVVGDVFAPDPIDDRTVVFEDFIITADANQLASPFLSDAWADLLLFDFILAPGEFATLDVFNDAVASAFTDIVPAPSVPAPATAGLAGLAMLLLGLRRRSARALSRRASPDA